MGFERQQFTFYRSFLNIIEQLPDRKQRDFMLTLIRYALNETEPITKDTAVKAAFEGIRPILDNARNKAQAGKIGGSVSPGNGQLSGKQNASKSKQTQANASRPEANASKRKQDTGEGTGEDTYSDTSIRGEGEEENANSDDFPAPPEREEMYQEIISQLCYYGISVGDKEKADIRALCDQYEGRAILDAIYAADQRNVRRWPYIRAIVTSGGVRQGKKGRHIIGHGDPPSPAMLQACREMLKEPEEPNEAEDRGFPGGAALDWADELLPEAVEICLELGKCQTSILQRRLQIGYARAARIIDEMEERGIVGPLIVAAPREVLISREGWETMKQGTDPSLRAE